MAARLPFILPTVFLTSLRTKRLAVKFNRFWYDAGAAQLNLLLLIYCMRKNTFS